MTESIKQKLDKNNVRWVFNGTEYKLRRNYICDNGYNCTIWITTTKVTDRTVLKLIKDGTKD